MNFISYRLPACWRMKTRGIVEHYHYIYKLREYCNIYILRIAVLKTDAKNGMGGRGDEREAERKEKVETEEEGRGVEFTERGRISSHSFAKLI